MSLPSFGDVVGELADVRWWPLAVASVLHAAAVASRARAWQNILRDDFPEAEVRYRGIFGAYAAGVGINSVLPARLGDVVKLFLAKREVEVAGYPGIISTFLVMSVVDSLLALGFVLWALSTGAFPELGELVQAESWGTRLAANPAITTAVSVGVVLSAIILVRALRRHAGDAVRTFLRGFRVFKDWPFFLGRVVSWQVASWAFQVVAFAFFLEAWRLDASAEAAALVQAVGALAIAVPFTPSGAGAEQALLFVVFEDVYPEAALLSFAIGMRAALVLSNVVLGVAAIVLLLRTLRIHQIVRGEEELVAHLRAGVAYRLVDWIRRATRRVRGRDPGPPRRAKVGHRPD